MNRNIELKARCADLGQAKAAAIQAGARPAGLLIQTDTYFHVAAGRLKLREIQGHGSELIWYARPNQTGFRASDYVVSPVTDSASLLQALGSALGVRGVVRKRRELYLFENVRIHLDQVDRLGTFIEFEAVISPESDEQVSRERLAMLAEALEITDDHRVAVSYSDLAGM